MRDADGGAKERFHVCARLDAKQFAQHGGNVRLLLCDADSESVVVNVVARACISIDGVEALVYVADKIHADGAFFCAATQEIFFPVIEHIEERPRDGFEDGGFPSAVIARDGGDAAPEAELRALVRFDVVEFDSCDVHCFR